MLLNEDERYRVILGDCVEGMATLPSACADFSIFSPPFPQMFAYTEFANDIGNSEGLDAGDGVLHLSFFYRQLARIIKPGRVVMVHVTQIPRMKRIDKRGGTIDFRGLNIRLGERARLIWEYDWSVRRNPQAQAIRTRSRELQFQGLETDRVKSRGAMPDYLLKFRTQGENQVPVHDGDDDDQQVTRNQWIELAECTWRIRETDTLNVKGTKGEGDTKHICPLALPIIDPLIRLYTNPGELVFSPFAGIGSEGYCAVKLGRRFFGYELKAEYHRTALANLARAAKADEEFVSLYDFAEAQQ